jgi:hypothetical protein
MLTLTREPDGLVLLTAAGQGLWELRLCARVTGPAAACLLARCYQQDSVQFEMGPWPGWQLLLLQQLLLLLLLLLVQEP